MQALRRLFAGLVADRSGNVLALVGAAMLPLIALVGSSIDMGRAYLVQARLQAACDAGVLAGRKQLATYTGTDPTSQATPVQTRADIFFNNNFPSGFQGVTAKTFTTTVQADFSVSAAATATMPTTIMQVFRFTQIPLAASCRAKLNLPNTDVMMVLDTTGSMADTNPGDAKPKIDILRDVVKGFTTTLASVTVNGTRIRYGFVPYSANVNVGGLLKSDWLVDSWHYQGRRSQGTPGVNATWRYTQMNQDVRFLKGATGNDPPLVNSALVLPMGGTADSPQPYTSTFRGCVEERDTYEITDYGNVDFDRALDLNLDLVPTNNPSTQWRPMFNEFAADRALYFDASGNLAGSFSPADSLYTGDYFAPFYFNMSACPAAAQKLQTMTGAQVDAYLATLFPQGSTYHDIGMIWGGRLLSPTGLFAAENADVPGNPTQRHLIFLTDGMTSTLDLTYGTYGVEPLDQRRWSPSSPLSLNQTVESRFTVACNEVKRRNITVWVIGFGTTLNPVLTDCAGPGHSFSAANATQLNAVFANIAAQLGNLRIAP